MHVQILDDETLAGPIGMSKADIRKFRAHVDSRANVQRHGSSQKDDKSSAKDGSLLPPLPPKDTASAPRQGQAGEAVVVEGRALRRSEQLERPPAAMPPAPAAKGTSRAAPQITETSRTLGVEL